MLLKRKNTFIVIATDNANGNIGGQEDRLFMREIGRMPMICHVIRSAGKIQSEKIIIVTSYALSEAERNKIQTQNKDYSDSLVFITAKGINLLQDIQQAISETNIDPNSDILLAQANIPFIQPVSLFKMLEALNNGDDSTILPATVVLAAKYIDPGTFLKSQQHPTEDSLENDDDGLTLYQAGVMAIHLALLQKIITEPMPKPHNHKSTQSTNLNQIQALVLLANVKGLSSYYVSTGYEEIIYIHKKQEIAAAEMVFQRLMRASAVTRGITMYAPDTVFFTASTHIEENVTIHPYVVFGCNVTVGSGAEILPYSHIDESQIRENAIIGPFARIRAGSVIGKDTKIGNFVEIKNSDIGSNVKINHMSYVGDTNIGNQTNIGAGVITCNYDGIKKYRTTIGTKCFIGANTNLIAPIVIGSEAMIAAGSTITKDVPMSSLAISRGKQYNKLNGALHIKNIQIKKERGQ